MQLTNTWKAYSGVEYIFEYSDADSFEHLEPQFVRQVYGVCFCDGKIVLGWSCGRKEWCLIGGTIEAGETFEQTLKREIKEESNMEILAYTPIGCQKMIDTRDQSFVYQLRYACLAKPFGPFQGDPLGDIVKIELVDPALIKDYLKWGTIHDHIVERAIELFPTLRT